MPFRKKAIGLHWQVAQATSLVNVVVEMSTASGTNHQGKKSTISCCYEVDICAQGIFMENGRYAFTLGVLVRR